MLLHFLSPLPCFEGHIFQKGDTNMNMETKIHFYQMKWQTAVFTRNLLSLHFCKLSAMFAEYVYKIYVYRK